MGIEDPPPVQRELHARLVALEEKAFVEFGEVFGPRFRRYFESKGLNRSAAEDLADSLITDLALKASAYKVQPGASFTAWVMTSARNAMVDWLRKQPDDISLLPLDEALVADTGSVDSYEEEHASGSEWLAALEDALEQLTAEDRKVIQLRDLESGWTWDQIAEQLGKKSGAARTQHVRVMKKLRAILEQDPRIHSMLDD